MEPAAAAIVLPRGRAVQDELRRRHGGVPAAPGPHRPRASIIAAAYALAFTGNDFLLQAVMIPFLVFSLAAIGLNILTGYAGLLSLGTGAFMGVGAYACYKLTTAFPGVNIIVWILASGLFSAGDRGAVRPAVPAHQGLLPRGRDARGAVLPAMVLQPRALARTTTTSRGRSRRRCGRCSACRSSAPTATPQTRYLVVLTLVILLTWVASNLVHGRIGRMWMAIRDMDIAAELMGIKLLHAEAPRLRGVVLLLRRRRGHDGVPLVRRRRIQRLRHQPVLLHPVHGHHRRARAA